MSTVLRALLLSGLLTLAPVTIGVVVAGDPTPEREAPAYVGTDLADFDTSTAVVQRAPFCLLVPDGAVEAALADQGAVDLTDYRNGEESEVLPGGDVAHEHGCRFGTDGLEARAWVFAPPVGADRAQDLVAAAVTKKCAARTDAPAYGEPSVAVVCTRKAVRTASYRGLFGDAWLACSLTLPVAVEETELLARTGRWCVAVAQAASVPTS